MKYPSISVITPSLNRVGMIETAVESVRVQKYPSFEHIIVDGGSTDGTLDRLQKYGHLKVTVEQDDGMYAALNRGVERASGEILCFLNTDDRFLADAFSQVATIFTQQAPDAIIGQAIMNYSGKKPHQDIIRIRPEHWWDTLILGVPIFNAWFFQRGVFERLGGFDTTFKIAGDRDLLIRFGLANLTPAFSEQAFYEYTVHPGSLSMGLNAAQVYRKCTEHLWMVEKWQDQVKHLPQVHQNLQQLARREIAEMVIQGIKDGSPRKVLSYTRLGMRREPGFLIFLSRKITRLFFSKLRRQVPL